MKLCIVTHNVIKGDGQGRATYEIVYEAIRRGHLVTLLASNVAPDLHHHEQVNWIYIPVKQYPTQLLRGMAYAWKSSAWLRLHRTEFDLIQVQGAIVTEPSDVNVAHFIHSSWLQSPAHPARQRTIYGSYQWLYSVSNAYQEKKAYQRAKTIVAVSEKVKQEVIEIGIHANQVQVILNGVDTTEFYPGTVARTQIKLPADVPLALFVGDIRTNRKNLDTLLCALVQVPSLHLAVVGKVEGSPYPQMAIHLDLEQRVHFLGYRQDIPNVMRAADLFVFPSRYDPFGMVVTEAMATGLPVITTHTTGASDLVTQDCGIVLSDSENVQELAQALRVLADNSSLRQSMGLMARVIAQRHSWVSKAKAYVDLFETMSLR